ncbi:predicted protein [Sclerotinia sclerotiorum 1980 UF-70]|uniref:Uncharacterized protein n=1 Tax=Sclerotinia sclerotiorum (strain ATCC 18683 / 1980 / Ss-1) TaxID=665079 RepID=A7ERZ1_SCLS1|nr:predicted protein [Sclerotinia sclerotiorum 1980 UF-70]EDN92233.1 predicted protein [Sclerotinia sclerotiorum 1980 UF-70]
MTWKSRRSEVISRLVVAHKVNSFMSIEKSNRRRIAKSHTTSHKLSRFSNTAQRDTLSK